MYNNISYLVNVCLSRERNITYQNVYGAPGLMAERRINND